MSGFTLTLKSKSDVRLDMSGLTPGALAHSTSADVERMPVGPGLTVGDAFQVSGSAGDHLTISGSTPHLDMVGARLDGGNLLVEGDVGAFAAANMKAGRLEIRGSAGTGLGSAMRGGVVHVTGSAGDLAGGVRHGERYGMQGGTIVVEGDIGHRAGDRMRRGTIVARGSFGRWAGTRMMGGTLWTTRGFGDEPGIQMRRGTLIGQSTGRLLPTFRDGGVHDLVILRILSRDLCARLGPLAPPPLPKAMRKFSGDLSIFGKGELLLPV